MTDLVHHLRFEEHAIGVEAGTEQTRVHDLERGALSDLFVHDRVDRAHAATAELALDDPRPGLDARQQPVRHFDRGHRLRSRRADHGLHNGFG